MTDRTQFEAMLEALINEDQETAKDIFHNIVVAKSREIYEELLESDFPPAKEEEGAEGGDDGEDKEDDSEIGGDATDDFEKDIENDDDEAEDDADDMSKDEGDVEDRVQDLEDALEDLKAEFEQLMSQEEGEGHDFGGEEEPAGDEFGGEEPGMDGEEPDMDFGGETEEDEGMDPGAKKIEVTHHHSFMEDDEALIREYVEKVGMDWDSAATSQEGGHVGAQAGSVTGATNTTSIVNGRMVNDMGGTTANIAQGDKGVEVFANKGKLQGTGVLSGEVVPNPDAKGNINVPGGKAGKTGFKTQVAGGGIDRQSGFNKPGKNVGANTGAHSNPGESNTHSIVNGKVGGARKK